MAAAQKVVTVDLGASTIKFAEFGLSKGGGLTLLQFGVAELGLDANKEEERAKFVTPTLAKLFARHKIKGREVRLSISGQSTFTKFVKLPPVDAVQIEQVVTFEAQQNVPFPIQEVTWDYQVMPTRGTAATEAEAVIVAIKKDVVEAEIRAVEEAGVRVKQVDSAPFALLNSFRYNDPSPGECALIIDMGARATNVLFVEKGSFWHRNIPIAGNQISQAICNDMQEPFIAAEMLKKGKGFVSLGGIYSDPEDGDAARISKLIRATMTRLHVDINRSIAFYRTTLGGSSPRRVFLTGGSSQLPYLDLFFADKLGLPVTYFNPLKNVTLAPAIERSLIQQNYPFTSELVGLAVRETGSCPAEISLEAPTLAARRDKKRKQPYLYGALAAWAALWALIALSNYRQANEASAVTEQLRGQTTGLQGLAANVTKNASQVDALRTTLDQVATLGEQANLWPTLLANLNDHIPDGVWITSLKPGYIAPPNARPGGKANQGDPNRQDEVTDRFNVLIMEGLYHSNGRTQTVDNARIGDFVRALADLPSFNIDKNNLSDSLPSSTTTEPGVFAQSFSLRLKLKSTVLLRP